MGNAIFL
ncbi:hypothetical protein CP8484711_1029A, partial [Chlamydia psittaci 84-8471/1]